MIPTLLRPFFPVLYQNPRKRENYFEDWHFKHHAAPTDFRGADRRPRVLSVMPGISRSDFGDHAFVQVVDCASGGSRYFKFAADAFEYRDSPFEIRIEENRFSLDGIRFDLDGEHGRIKGDLRYLDAKPPRLAPLGLGAQGLFGHLPHVDCRHAIASMDHGLEGAVEFFGPGSRTIRERVEFGGGRGYIDKDWGRSLPHSWLWIQSNSFDGSAAPEARAALSFRLASESWTSRAFNNLICLFTLGGREYRFATYAGARVELLEYDRDSIRIMVKDFFHKLEILVRRSGSCRLAAPTDGAMKRRIVESMDSMLRVVLKRCRGSTEDIVYSASTKSAAVEFEGDAAELLA